MTDVIRSHIGLQYTNQIKLMKSCKIFTRRTERRKDASDFITCFMLCYSGGTDNNMQRTVDIGDVLWQTAVKSTCCMKALEWFRKISRQSKWATQRERYAVNCARKPTTWRAAGFSTTDTDRRVNCLRTLASGWRLLVLPSTVRLGSNSIDDYAVPVRDRLSSAFYLTDAF